MAANENELSREYSDEKFWVKIKKYAVKAGRDVLLHALTMYYTLQDKDTPKWAKGIIIGALGYFILPMDAIPDILPGGGFADDYGALAAALGMVAMHIKPEHTAKAEKMLEKWFGRDEKA